MKCLLARHARRAATWKVELVAALDDVPDHLVDVAPEGYLVMARCPGGSCLALSWMTCAASTGGALECRAFERGSRVCWAARRCVGVS